MATKWKNTAKRLQGFVKLHWTQTKYILGALLLIPGVWMFYVVIVYRTWHTTGDTIFFGILGNIFVGTGGCMIVSTLLKQMCGGMWMPEEDPYKAWKKTGKGAERKLCQAGVAALICSLWYMWHLLSGGVWNGGGWHYNYAAGYMMIFTVFVQFILLYAVFLRFRRKDLDLLHEQQDLEIQKKIGEVTEQGQKRLEEALEIERKSLEQVSRSDQLRVDLITNVSHDLKTPLTSMVGYIELIKKEDLSDVIRDYVEVISERADKLKEMINSLFNLAKASSGNIELRPEKFEVNRLIGQLLADMDDRIRESGLEFVTLLTEESTELCTDNGYFYRICQNLVENALKYSAKGTRVFVRTSIENGEKGTVRANGKTPDSPAVSGGKTAPVRARRICLEITNTAGYPMDFTKEDIVERFARGDKARSGDGNGLGLAIVSTYAKALGGEFDIKIDCDQFKACLKF